ncbi:hypothetical protein M2283_007025 [Streptomyces pseudovenezuelae]|uniref:Uncharacterized protein n=1 Tax=Streptomyces pseudovenezuelae TaxID=67350 RepID=A0ABT6LVJ2_9ACTN|nr:hypothetical protein [Streptomyces pseudovenezuelae]
MVATDLDAESSAGGKWNSGRSGLFTAQNDPALLET